MKLIFNLISEKKLLDLNIPVQLYSISRKSPIITNKPTNIFSPKKAKNIKSEKEKKSVINNCKSHQIFLILEDRFKRSQGFNQTPSIFSDSTIQ